MGSSQKIKKYLNFNIFGGLQKNDYIFILVTVMKMRIFLGIVTKDDGMTH